MARTKIRSAEQIDPTPFPTVSVDGELALFNGTTGAQLKRATGTGIVTVISGVQGVATNGVDINKMSVCDSMTFNSL